MQLATLKRAALLFFQKALGSRVGMKVKRLGQMSVVITWHQDRVRERGEKSFVTEKKSESS